jgi:hypothetical protein
MTLKELLEQATPLPWKVDDPVLRRFFANIEPGHTNECWEWNGGRNKDGYGIFYASKRDKWLAHRLAMAVNLGLNPGRICVLHKCDNPPCCNPAHLFLGTRGDNVADCWAKGRRIHPMMGRCMMGHLIAGKNAIIWKCSRSQRGVQRKCRICYERTRANRNKKRRELYKAKAEANNPQ